MIGSNNPLPYTYGGLTLISYHLMFLSHQNIKVRMAGPPPTPSYRSLESVKTQPAGKGRVLGMRKSCYKVIINQSETQLVKTVNLAAL